MGSISSSLSLTSNRSSDSRCAELTELLGTSRTQNKRAELVNSDYDRDYVKITRHDRAAWTCGQSRCPGSRQRSCQVLSFASLASVSPFAETQTVPDCDNAPSITVLPRSHESTNVLPEGLNLRLLGSSRVRLGLGFMSSNEGGLYRLTSSAISLLLAVIETILVAPAAAPFPLRPQASHLASTLLRSSPKV